MVLLALASSATARAAHAGRLDPSFGEQGRVVFPPGGGVGGLSEIVAAPAGSVVVLADALEGRLIRLRSDGSLDAGFDRGGRLVVGELAAAEGVEGRFFHVTNTAVDSRGRVLVFGNQIDNSHRVEGGGNLPFLPETNALVFRFDRAGERDRSFGAGRGFIRSSFGLGLPNTEPPVVGAMVGRVDSQDRPVLVAGVSLASSACSYGRGSPRIQPRAVIRLTRSGRPDPTFGAGDGVSPIEGSSFSPGLAIDNDDGLVVGAGRTGGSGAACRPGTTLYRLGPDGERLAGFGTDGALVFKALHLAALAPSGKIVLARRSGHTLVLARLRADGSRDMSFGHNGSVGIRGAFGAGGFLWPDAVDRKGRILLAGFTRSATSGPAKDKARRSAFVVTRLLPDGKPDRSFGDHGWIVTRLPRSLELSSAQATLDRQGRLLVAGTVTTPGQGGEGFVVARYLLGP